MSPSTPYAREPGLPGDGSEGRALGVVVPAATSESGFFGPASREEPHPAISIAIATAIAIRRYERLGLIVVMGRVSRSCTPTHLLSRFGHGEADMRASIDPRARERQTQARRSVPQSRAGRSGSVVDNAPSEKPRVPNLFTR